MLPFPVHGQSELAYLREGMVDLLSAKLEGAAGLRSIDPRAVLAAVEQEGAGTSVEPERAGQVAEQVGAGYFVVGDVVEIAGRIQLTGALYRVGAVRQPITKASVSGETTSLFELVDDLTGRLLPDLSRGRDSVLTRLAAMTTHSLPALKEFLEGERALRAGHDARAAVAFRNAALLDTTFALAQYRLALTATWVIAPDAPDPSIWAAVAARHAERLTPLVRDLLTAYRSYRSFNAEDAERRYREILAGHPDNVEAWMMLGETLFHFSPHRGRSPLEAWPAFARASALDSANAHATIHLARLAAAFGRRAALDSLARVYLTVNRDAERAIEMQALVAYSGDDPAEQAAVAAQAQQADERVNVAVLQAALMYAQDVASAPQLAAPYVNARIGDPVVYRHGRRLLSDAVLAQGTLASAPVLALLGSVADRDWLLETQALLAAEPLFSAPHERVAALRDSVARRRDYPVLSHFVIDSSASLATEMRWYLLGLLSTRLGDEVGADRYAGQLESVRGHRAAPARELAHALRAEIARSKGDLPQALAHLDQFHIDAAGPGIRGIARWGVRERFLRAEVLHAQGRDDEALAVYDSFLGFYDLPWIAATHLRRGEILEKKGEQERARFHYARAARLWSGCDEPLRPLVARAERLGAQGVSSSR